MTNSLAFPIMFDISRNKVGVIEDKISVVNRYKLLILTEPTELYNNPNFGVGLKRYLWQYNTENTKAIIKDQIVTQLRLHEPSCDADKTSLADGLLFTGGDSDTSVREYDKLKLTVGIQTIFSEMVNINLTRDELLGKNIVNPNREEINHDK